MSREGIMRDHMHADKTGVTSGSKNKNTRSFLFQFFILISVFPERATFFPA